MTARDDLFLARQIAQLGFTANALHPLRRLGIPAFFAGWPTTELAPHIATVTALDAGIHTARRGVHGPRDVAALGLAGLNLAGLGALTVAGLHAGDEMEQALVETLGADYRDVITRPTTRGDDHASWASLAWPFRIRDSEVVVERGLSYAPGGRRYAMDVYHRRDTPPGAPALLQIHGGAWITGTKDEQGVPLMMHMAARGWVCASINYPLSPRSKWPEHLIAIKRALRWLREDGAAYGVDPSFVAVTGGSAGGHLAAMTGLTANDPRYQPGFEDVDTGVQACAPHYGVYDFTAESGSRSSQLRLDAVLRRWVMSADAEYPADYRAASPLSNVRADAPPFLVVHGTNDSVVPIGEARAFVTKLRATSREPVVYAEIGGAQHAFDVFPSIRSAAVLRGVARFLEWTRATSASTGVESGEAVSGSR